MVVFGAKGFAKEVIEVLLQNEYSEEIFLFDDYSNDQCEYLYNKYKIIKTHEEFNYHLKTKGYCGCLIGVGAITRQLMSNKIKSFGGQLKKLISKHAIVGHNDIVIEDGAIIMPFSQITASVFVGEGSLINKAAILSHDVEVGSYCDIAPGAKIMGRTKVGNCTEIGANATLLPKIKIGSNCRVGAGSVVTKNFPDNVTIVGVPARIVG